MKRHLDRRGLWKLVTLALAAGVAISPATSLRVAASPRGGGTGSLSVATEPAGATVFIDGSVAGQTPLQVSTVDTGDHRVRVVKDGYVENARVVTVAAAQTKSVYVKLTKKEAAAAVDQVTSTPSGGGGGSKKWLWIGLAGAGAATATVLALNQNHAPTAGNVTVSPTATGMAGVTSFAFSSTASDEDGDNLSFSWNFGDNGTGTGATPTHVYATAGTFTVSLTVSDGKKDVTAPTVSVRVGPSLTGNWTGGNDFQCGINTNLTQNGANLTGQMIGTATCTGTVTITSGTVGGRTHPAQVTWSTGAYTFPGFRNPLMSRFNGTTDANGTVLSGTITVSDTVTGGTQGTQTTFRR
jgi:PKD repeat protein